MTKSNYKTRKIGFFHKINFLTKDNGFHQQPVFRPYLYRVVIGLLTGCSADTLPTPDRHPTDT